MGYYEDGYKKDERPVPVNPPSPEETVAVIASLAAKLAVLVLSAYQRDDEAAMRAFGSNAEQHIANDLSRALMWFKLAAGEAEPKADALLAEPAAHPGDCGCPRVPCQDPLCSCKAQPAARSEDKPHLNCAECGREHDPDRGEPDCPECHLCFYCAKPGCPTCAPLEASE